MNWRASFAVISPNIKPLSRPRISKPSNYRSVFRRHTLAPRGLRHAPAVDRGALDRAEHQALGRKADPADDEKRCQHHIGIEKLLGVEDDPAQSPIRTRQHL